MKICVIGSGYVGLVTGACLADFGVDVTNVDIDPTKIETLNAGEIPIYEPGLKTLVRKNMDHGRLHFTTELGPAVESSTAVFIAVGTPPGEDGSSDLRFVRQVAHSIAGHLNGFKVIITKSTVPVGTGQMIREIVHAEAGEDADFAVVSNPEFLREGSAIEDFLKPDRLVIGSDDPRAIEVMHDIYSPLRVADVPFVVTNVETSEMIKYASNSFLATKISFINEVAELCERVGADVEVVARGMGLDKRIGSQFLHPGPGFGGSCFPKDTQAIAHLARENGTKLQIVESVLEVNDRIKRRMVDKVADAVGELKGKTVGILGLAFKPETDDMRDSPSIPLIEGLVAAGAEIRAYDPAAMEVAAPMLPPIETCEEPYGVADGADALVIVTEWNEFRKLELGRLLDLMNEPVLVDLRNIYEPTAMKAAGFRYSSVGRPDRPGGTS